MALGSGEEYFAWRRSRKATINKLRLSCKGYELLRLNITGVRRSPDATNKSSDNVRLVATCAASSTFNERTMVLRYLASLGYEWEVVSLVTLLVFWLLDRKPCDPKHRMKG
jgi:hypothetical protein